MVRGIHPPILTDRGLAGAVRALAASSGLDVNVQADDLDDGPRAPAAVESAAYFVVAEALTNAAKHSGSKRAAVELSRTRTGLRVVVRDEGKGGATTADGADAERNRPARHAPPGRRARRDLHRHQPRRRPDRDRNGAAVRVVIAEDNALLREGLVLLLTSAGHEVVAVAGAEPEILPALLAHRPDIAVLDVRMPPNFRDEGLRAALAARRQIPGLPVLVLSQYVEEVLRRRTARRRRQRDRLPAQGPGWPGRGVPRRARPRRGRRHRARPRGGHRTPHPPPQHPA